MIWKKMVLMNKVEGYFRGIGFVEGIWNFFNSVMNNHLQSAIMLHDALHFSGKGRRLEQPLWRKIWCSISWVYDTIPYSRCS